MTEEKRKGQRKKIGERATSILTEPSGKANDGSKIMAQMDEGHNTTGEEKMAGEKTENQGAKWPEMMTGMWNNMPAFTSSNKAMAPFAELMKMQQQHGMNMSRVWVDQLSKIGEASRSGDVKKLWETCQESNKEIIKTCQESMKEQATARYEFLRTLIPAMPGFTGDRT